MIHCNVIARGQIKVSSIKLNRINFQSVGSLGPSTPGSSISGDAQETNLSQVLSGEILPRIDNYQMPITPGII